jgi:DNA-binding SARP family transcriptional activator
MPSILLLGPIELRIAGATPALSAKDRALLAALGLRAGRPVSVASLTDFLWEQMPPAKSAQSIHTYVRRLRRYLGDQIRWHEGQGYALEVEADQIDVARFNVLFDRACELRISDAAGCQAVASEALDLWRGTALAGVETFPASHARNVLEETRLSTTELVLRCRLDRGEAGSVAAELQQLVILHPQRASFWALLMVTLYRNGRQSDALKAGQRGAAQLRTPSDGPVVDLRRVEAAILTQDPALDDSLLGSAHAAAL